MRRRTFLLAGTAAASGAGIALLGDLLLSRREGAKGAVSVGILSGGFLDEHIEAFRLGLRDHGWLPGKDITVIHKDVGSDIDQLPSKADELAARGVRVIVSTGPAPTSAVMKTHPSLPVVMCGNFDPIRAGLIASFAQPGGNVTGVVASVGLDTKRVEFLKQLVPESERLAFITNISIAGQDQRAAEIDAAASTLGLRLRVFDVRSPSQIDAAFDAAREWGAHLLFPSAINPMTNARAQVIGHAARLRLAAVYSNLDWVRAGGLAGLGPELSSIYRRAASYVDKILRGSSPAQLPVERSSRFELLVNRRTLVDLGLTLPPDLVRQVTNWID